MDNLTPQQEKKLRRIAKIVDDGPLAIAEHIFDLEEKFDEVVKDFKKTVPDIKEVLQSVKGKDGNDGTDYIITEDDKKEMAGMAFAMVDVEEMSQMAADKVPVQEIADKITAGIEIPVKVVEKIIEKTEVIRETPIVTENVVQVAVADEPEQLRDKLETLKEDERLDKSAVKGLDEELERIARLKGKGGGFRGVGLSDGVKGDITVDGSGSTFTLNNGKVGVLINAAIALTSGDGIGYFRIPAEWNGWKLTLVAFTRLSGTGTPSIQFHNNTQNLDMLSTNVTIDSSETDSTTAATPYVINTSNNQVATADRIRIDVDDAGTSTLWGETLCVFTKP